MRIFSHDKHKPNDAPKFKTKYNVTIIGHNLFEALRR